MEWEVIPTLLLFIIQESSSTFTVPKGVKKIDVFCVGGGAGGGGGYNFSTSSSISGSGGGSGYTITKLGVDITEGEQLGIVIGSGSGGSVETGRVNSGGTSSIGNICSANGGAGHNHSTGGDGGSGGGFGYYFNSYSGPYWSYSSFSGTNGGQDGNDTSVIEESSSYDGGSTYKITAKGQGTTTRYFGESTGTLYAGGGGGGATGGSTATVGGAGGGGKGGEKGAAGSAGATNTGGGGGGGSMLSNGWFAGGDGGSGICIIRWTKDYIS